MLQLSGEEEPSKPPPFNCTTGFGHAAHTTATMHPHVGASLLTSSAQTFKAKDLVVEAKQTPNPALPEVRGQVRHKDC